jgi:hypothetical protein
MNGRPVATLGVAITTFLAVVALVTEALASRIAFSAIVGLPVGVVAGAVAGLATWARLWRRPRARAPLIGTAAFGYALLAFAAVSYAVPAARGFVSVGTALPFAAVCALAAFPLARRDAGRTE